MTAEAIASWLVDYLAKELAVAPETIDRRAALTDLGLGSRQAVILAGDLEDWLGRELDATVVYEHPSVEALAAFLAA